jgi:hypothetical protein
MKLKPKDPAETKTTASPFLLLAVDLPPPPLFQDAVEKNIIPQVGIHAVLSKYNGIVTQVRSLFKPLKRMFVIIALWQESRGQLRRYKCQQLPAYIILHYKRFTKNNFVEEKNPTIVNFPLRGVNFSECEPVEIVNALDAHFNLLVGQMLMRHRHPSRSYMTLWRMLSWIRLQERHGTRSTLFGKLIFEQAAAAETTRSGSRSRI